MKRIFLMLVAVLFFAGAFGQKVNKISINRDGSLDMIAFLLDENITLNMTSDGSVNAWGIEVYSERVPNYSKLDTYLGRIEYYTQNDNEAFRGKVKYIGKTLITYFASYDNESFRGKVKSIGSTYFEYYTNFENEAIRGKIKTAGTVPFGWYSTYDNEALRGKLKSVGNTSITYYTSFDDKAIKGKLKGIDNASFTYYTSLDRIEYRGSLKSGTQMQTINGIKYYVKF